MVGAMGLGAGVEAHAQSTASAQMERFDTLCVATTADRARVRAAAAADGWMVAPQDMFPPDEAVTNPEAWMSSSVDGMLFAFVADLEYSEGGETLPMTACAVGMAPKAANFEAELDRFAGGNKLPDFSNGEAQTAYGFRVVDGVSAPAPAMGTIATMRALLLGELHIVIGKSEEDSTLVMYMVPKV